MPQPYRNKALLISLCLVLGWPRLAWALKEWTPTALEVIGPAEVFEPSLSHWTPLEKSMALKRGSKIRTGDQGSTHIIFDGTLDTVVRLAQNSQVSFPKDKGHLSVSLERGRLFLVREEKAVGFFEIHSRQLKIKMRLGGLILDASKQRVVVRVYGGHVYFEPSLDFNRIGMGTLGEGFKLFRFSLPKHSDRVTRVGYRDYLDWQPWARRWYEMKDDFKSDLLEKEMNW